MRRSVRLAASVSAAITHLAVAEYACAFSILTAEVANGVVHVKGRKATRLALMTWEGQPVAQATAQGGFRFKTSIMPGDCVGVLSDGVRSMPVVVRSCGQVGPRGVQGLPGPNCGFCPTPLPTTTPSSTGTDCNGQGAALSATLTSLPGADLDIGWTGLAHNSVASHSNRVVTDLNCANDDCTVDGADLVNQPVGSPLPLSAGGVSSCVINTFREAITGTYNCESGCGESSVLLVSRVFLVIDQDKPCPPCVDDPVENDGVKGGTCDGGKTPGAACDVGGISDLFQNAGGAPPDAGRTSIDCEPTGSPVGALNIDLNPLTTGTVTVESSVNCLSAAFPPGSCYCPGQVQANSCTPDGICPASGLCENSPPIGVCSNARYRSCFLTSSPTADCEDIAPGSGTCQAELQPCFGETISRAGTCGTEEGTLVSIFCIPATQAAAINTTAGLPGPGALMLPVHRLRVPR